MDFILANIKVPIEEGELNLISRLAQKLKIPAAAISNLRILRRAVDARQKPHIFFVYTLQFTLTLPHKEIQRLLRKRPELKQAAFNEPLPVFKPEKKLTSRPLVIGSGPAGYFAGLTLARHGYRPLILERGDDVEERVRKVQSFWTDATLDPESNIQFGEGGAGTFSDGKLTTRIHDRRISEVLETYVRHGAPREILYLAKPHIGTDVLRQVVKSMRREIETLGGEIRFRSKLTGINTRQGRLLSVVVNKAEEIEAEALILAIGHSSRDTYQMLHQAGVVLEQKAFAIGLRVEHPQSLINIAQYGVEEHPLLGPADYQLTYQDQATGRGAYAFCMCPGGQVVAAASEEGGVVTNGMSESRRASGVANSALVITVGPSDFGSSDPLAGIEFQRVWERKAFDLGGRSYAAPAQGVADFLHGRLSTSFKLTPSYAPATVAADLHQALPLELGQVMERAIVYFGQKIRGFDGEQGVLTGVESRTSAPLRILRDEQGESVSVKGLFPAGEGAGYAGGITSAAVDGIRIAERLMTQYAAHP